MIDMIKTVEPKTDQLNADSLIGGAKTIKITGVKLCAEPEQPIAISYEGDGGKPYKPCKSMRRVLICVWGGDGNKFIGRSLTLYRDEKVLFGGQAAGRIRISHMSDISAPVTMALTASKSARKPYTVQPLKAAPAVDIEELHAAGLGAAKEGRESFLAWYNSADVKPHHAAIKRFMGEFQAAVEATSAAKAEPEPAKE